MQKLCSVLVFILSLIAFNNSIASVNKVLEGENDTITVSFKVKGKLACKNTIESLVSSKQGVLSASWNAATEIITVQFIPAVIVLSDLHSAIAVGGYDTSELRTKDTFYSALPAECKYTRDPITE